MGWLLARMPQKKLWMDLPQPSLSSEAGPIASNQPEKMRSTAQPKRGAAQYDNSSFLNAFCSFHLMML